MNPTNLQHRSLPFVWAFKGSAKGNFEHTREYLLLVQNCWLFRVKQLQKCTTSAETHVLVCYSKTWLKKRYTLDFSIENNNGKVKQKQIEVRYSEGVSQRILKKLQDAVASG